MTIVAEATLFEAKPGNRAGITPRPYQVETHDNCFRLWDKGERGVLVRAATGVGKSYMAALCLDTWLKRSPNHRCMVISYEQQLVWQFAQEVEDLLGLRPGIEMGDERLDPARLPSVIVASRQSLLRAPAATSEQLDGLAQFGIPPMHIGSVPERSLKPLLKLLRKGVDPDVVREELQRLNSEPEASDGWSRLHKFDWRHDWLVIMDEAHRYAYKLLSVGHVVDWFDRNPNSKRCGITATPRRSDGVSIGDKMFPAVALDYPLFKPAAPCAVGDGYAVKYLQRYIEVEGVDFAQLAKVAGDFDENELQLVLGEESQLARLIEPLLDMVGDRQTLIFSPGVEMAKNVARYINARSRSHCPACGKVKWSATLLIGDGAVCPCGRPITLEDVDRKPDQARELDGSSPPPERKQIYAEHKAGKFQFLSVCGLCVSKDTRILTDKGEVPIQDVTTQMHLWDGVEFVRHSGVIFMGHRPVIEYAGLRATEGHRVWTAGGWETLAKCQQQRFDIAVAGINGRAVPAADGHYRSGDAQGPTATEEVYDILNAGPRHRFTANGLIVSNCREGYNDPGIACVAVFRPVSRAASSLAEQMKGRACRVAPELASKLHAFASNEERLEAIAQSSKPDALIVDLVGCTGLADCASTVQIYAEGLPDEVTARAEVILAEGGLEGAMPVEEAIEQAKREDAQAREKVRLEREAAERRAREVHERRAKADARVSYTTHEVGVGSAVDANLASPAQLKFIAFLGMEILSEQLTRKQAGRVIDQLQRRLAPDEVARQNRLGEGQWRVRGPSVKQRQLLLSRGVRHDWVKTPYDASLLISALMNPSELEERLTRAIGEAKTNEQLTVVANDLKLVRSSVRLDDGLVKRVIATGVCRRDALRGPRVVVSEEPIPE